MLYLQTGLSRETSTGTLAAARVGTSAGSVSLADTLRVTRLTTFGRAIVVEVTVVDVQCDLDGSRKSRSGRLRLRLRLTASEPTGVGARLLAQGGRRV